MFSPPLPFLHPTRPFPSIFDLDVTAHPTAERTFHSVSEEESFMAHMVLLDPQCLYITAVCWVGVELVAERGQGGGRHTL